jgi:hypothetical protein
VTEILWPTILKYAPFKEKKITDLSVFGRFGRNSNLGVHINLTIGIASYIIEF